MDKTISWLTENSNPAIKYRTLTELLSGEADKQQVSEWITGFLPTDWQETKGLWYNYYLTAIAECGLTYQDVDINKSKALDLSNVEFSCGDFMRLRALIMLGFQNEPQILEILDKLNKKQLPDGGFLCLHRVDKMKYQPKSCVKSNNIALLFCSECKKRGIELSITDDLLSYYWKHNLFYRTSNLSELIIDAREGWRTIDVFFPFEVMRVGLQNIVEAFSALGYGNDERLTKAWDMLNAQRNDIGQVLLNGTLTKSYLPKERVGKPSKWATFYTLLAEKLRTI